MTENAKKLPVKTSAASEPTAKKRGRQPSPETLKFFWYRDVDGFEKCDLKPWWGRIQWEGENRARRAKRSIQHRELMPHTIHAGFLWETLRRLPDFPTLLEEFRRLGCGDLVGKDPLPPAELDILAETQRAFVAFLDENGMPVLGALTILSKNWKLCFENLPQESRDRWERYYVALWNKVGDPGSIPATPAELPATEPREYWGPGRTAFDLLIKHPGGHLDGNKAYEDHPLPSMFLRAFAKLRPSKESEGSLEPHSGFAPGKTEPCTYPWLSFGILESHLGKYHLHPLALAVDLSKSTEMIVRDLKKIIEQKRKSLGIEVADRRIKKESFDKITALDEGVFGSSDTPLLARTVKEFEASARLNLRNLINQMRMHMDCGKQGPPQKKQTLDKEVKKLLDESMRQSR